MFADPLEGTGSDDEDVENEDTDDEVVEDESSMSGLALTKKAIKLEETDDLLGSLEYFKRACSADPLNSQFHQNFAV